MTSCYSQPSSYGCSPQLLGFQHSPSGLNPPVEPRVKIEIAHAIMDERNLPKHPDALIEGALRTGGKMVLFGKDKSWKSFLAIQLGVCVSTGSEWLGLSCKRGKALYFNLEIDEPAFMRRVYDVAVALGADPGLVTENFLIAKRPRASLTIKQFVNALIDEVEAKGCSLVIIDPQYKIFEGNENEQRDMAAFYAEIDRLISHLGCAVLVVHHQSKGYQGNKGTSERACGSNVFGRDPDAIVSIDRLNHPGNAMRAEFVLRDYPGIEPINYWFKHPLCIPDAGGELANCAIGYRKQNACATKAAEKLTTIEEACRARLEDSGKVKCAEVARTLGIKNETLVKYLERSELYSLEKDGGAWYVTRK